MRRRLARPYVLLLTPMIVLVLAAGCTSSSSGGATPASATSSSETATSPSAPASASATPSVSPTPSPSPSSADALTLDITIEDRQVSPSGEKINVTKGQTVVMHVSSDADDEVHAHTGGDGYELEVKAGVPATGQFVAADTGSFEVESHHLDKIIAILVVR